MQEKIGEGAFGMVYKGLVRIDGESRSCALKMLKGKWKLEEIFHRLKDNQKKNN